MHRNLPIYIPTTSVGEFQLQHMNMFFFSFQNFAHYDGCVIIISSCFWFPFL